MTKIMVVDDENDLREMLGLMLKKEGYEIGMAINGADFLDRLDDFQPDLVTLDVMMPGLTTLEILDKLKEKKTKTKVILLTVVRYSEEEKQQIFKMGNVIDYITKPFELDDLVNIIKKHMQ